MIVFLMSLVVQTWEFQVAADARPGRCRRTRPPRRGLELLMIARPSQAACAVTCEIRAGGIGAGWKTVVFETQHGT